MHPPAPITTRTPGQSTLRGARLIGLLLLLCAAAPAATRPDDAPAAPRPVRFGRDIRPLLSDRCFKCHGPDASKREAELRLDDRASATADRGGYAPIVPGDARASELWRRVTSADPDERMPPPDSHKQPLTPAEQALVRAWIDQGAAYEAHWSFAPPVKPSVPTPEQSDWCRNDVDRFILARLEAESVAPSPDADSATLFRRVFLDLTGLPPTPDEIDAFLADTGPDAYERLVDRLLTEEPYRSRTAERLTLPWLDAARYGDTSGIHTDNGRQMWAWRDWVLEAFRDNMPYDRFIVEQLAGDLLPDAATAQLVATGFNRNHVSTDEGGAIAEEYLVEYAAERVATTSTVFLGLTMGCARCHDHKFDPLTQDDFYSMFAFFNSIEEPGLYSQTPDARRAYEPFLEVPSAAQQQQVALLVSQIKQLEESMDKPIPGEDAQRDSFVTSALARAGVAWTMPKVVSAASSEAAVSLTANEDGSIQASGAMPDTEDYIIELESTALAQRLLLLEALPTPGAGPGAGRETHGNAVLTGLTLEARPAGDTAAAADWTIVPLRYAWADHAQSDKDYEAVNVLDPTDKLGWALDGNADAGARLLLLIADTEFGFESGTRLRATLAFRSPYPRHSIGRVRLRTAPAAPPALADLPVSMGRWYVVGPFPADGPAAAFETAFGPETLPTVDLSHNFGAGNQYWAFGDKLADERVVSLSNGVNATYVGRTIWSPDARELPVSLGSDDGFRLYVNGEQVAANQIDRSLAPDQDKAVISLRPGANSVILKVVNTGGESGYYFRAIPPDGTLKGALAMALLPTAALSAEHARRFTTQWRRAFLPAFRDLEKERDTLARQLTETNASIPRTMIMKERAEPRPAFVLTRGQYDQPDQSRPAPRRVPAALGQLSRGAPQSRLGLARWITSPDNPLAARVAVNRYWEVVFGVGLVATSEDFGQQGEWPSHPELLDYLAVEFREHAWDVRWLLTQLVTSRTYRQTSRVRDDLAQRDPHNRLLAYYPRRRLSAEAIRDLALSTSGLLVEQLGGPSVKPYQPEGLWQEVAMPASNTRIFDRGAGDDLWRRSLYTYWKRACPPPSLQTLDAPTREACVIRRPTTSTPLQALVLWNDEQFVEAARMLAQRTLLAPGSDDDRLTLLFRRCTGRAPGPEELPDLRTALADFRARYTAAPDDAKALLSVGMAPRVDSLAEPELAAWTMLAGAALNLHETITQD